MICGGISSPERLLMLRGREREERVGKALHLLPLYLSAFFY
jgi:hypothetical protein